MRRLPSLFVFPLLLWACGAANNGPGPATAQDAGGSGAEGGGDEGGVVVGPDGGVIVGEDGGPIVIPPSDPQIRYVAQDQTVRIDVKTLQYSTVLAASYSGLARVREIGRASCRERVYVLV